MKSAFVSLAVFATVAFGQTLTINTPYVLWGIVAKMVRLLINLNAAPMSLSANPLSSLGVEELVRDFQRHCRTLVDLAIIRPLLFGSFIYRSNLLYR